MQQNVAIQHDRRASGTTKIRIDLLAAPVYQRRGRTVQELYNDTAKGAESYQACPGKTQGTKRQVVGESSWNNADALGGIQGLRRHVPRRRVVSTTARTPRSSKPPKEGGLLSLFMASLNVSSLFVVHTTFPSQPYSALRGYHNYLFDDTVGKR